MNKIIFRNKGVIDPKSIVTFGVSSKTGSNSIGFFGTGLKYAIAILLRNKCSFTVYAGKKPLRVRKNKVRVPVMCPKKATNMRPFPNASDGAKSSFVIAACFGKFIHGFSTGGCSLIRNCGWGLPSGLKRDSVTGMPIVPSVGLRGEY